VHLFNESRLEVFRELGSVAPSGPAP